MAERIHEFREHVLEEVRTHARRANAADLLLIDEQAARRALRGLRLKHGSERCVGAHAVVLPVAEDHAAVEAHLASRTCGYEGKLRRQEVFFFDAVLFLQQMKHVLLHSLLFLARKRQRADEHIELLAFDDLVRRLLELLLRQVHEKIGHAEGRLGSLFADDDVLHRAVLLGDDAMQREGNRDPLILLDAAVIMRIEVGETAVLIERILLDVEAARVDVCTENRQAVFQRLRAYMKERDRLLHVGAVNLRARCDLPSGTHDFFKIFVACRLRLSDDLAHALALRLALRQKLDVAFGKRLKFLFLSFGVRTPRQFLLLVLRFCHNITFL